MQDATSISGTILRPDQLFRQSTVVTTNVTTKLNPLRDSVVSHSFYQSVHSEQT